MRRLVLATLCLTGCSDGPAGEPDANLPDADVETGVDVSHERIIPEVGTTDVDADVDAPTRVPFRLLTPASAVAGAPLPIVVHAINENGSLNESVNGLLALETTGDVQLEAADVLLRRGVGSITTDWSGTAGHVAIAGTRLSEIRTAAATPTALQGVVGDQTWDGESVTEVLGDLTIEGDLLVEAGAWVLLDDEVNIDVLGTTTITGTPERPVVFAPSDAAWGGLSFGDTAHLDNAFFIGGGADASREFGHSNSQPVLFGEGVTVELVGCVVQDAVGKAMGGRRGAWTIETTLVTRTDTGGEFEFCSVTVEESHYFDFPQIDPAPRDDDNDAIYLLGDPDDPEPPPILIRGSTFASGADDGIDHNGSTVRIEGSWVEGFDNECIAASAGGSVFVSDTALVGCAQGLEAGYGSPAVIGEHLLIIENDIGLRFGDSYERNYRGTLAVSASVIAGNRDRGVWNWMFGAEAPAEGRVSVSDSILDVDEAEGGSGNVIATPVLTDQLLLAPDSPGVGIASDGSDPGLLTGRSR